MEGRQPLPNLDGLQAAHARGRAADATTRARWLLTESRRFGAWPTLEDAFHRARLADVFALLADGHHEAAEQLRQTIPLPAAGMPTTADPSHSPTPPARSRGGASGAHHEAMPFNHPVRITPPIVARVLVCIMALMLAGDVTLAARIKVPRYKRPVMPGTMPPAVPIGQPLSDSKAIA